MVDSLTSEASGKVWVGKGKSSFAHNSDIKIQLTDKREKYKMALSNFRKEAHLLLIHKFRAKNEMVAIGLIKVKLQINSDMTLIENYEYLI